MSGERTDKVVQIDAAAALLREKFIFWQCRLRQLAVRREGGRPSAGMQPCVLSLSGEELAPRVTVLILPADPDHSIKLFRYQVLKTPDPAERYDKALEILAGSYFQRPREFGDVMTALFAGRSGLADRLLGLRHCLLAFEQYGQLWHLPCLVAELAESEPFYQATYWHNRLFNANMPAAVCVLSFTPDWRHASAESGESSGG